MQALIDLFAIKDLIPHGYCLLWSPVLLWLQVISDLLITLAYYSIPLMLVYFIRQRKDFPYPWLVVLFAGFIVACGTTHLLSVITIWIPLYWLDGLLKAFTAIISIVTAALMLRVIPRALSLPSPAQLQAEIRQRQAAEEALRESEHKLSTILDNVEAFIYIKDCNYQYQYVNQPVRELFDQGQEDIIGKSDEAFFDEATTAKIRVNDRRVIEQGERITSENRYTFKDKIITRTFLTVKQPLSREDGRTSGLCGISTDITERKQMEEKLRDSNAFKVSILNSLTSHIAVLDEQGVIIAVNNAWRQFAKENSLLEFSQDMLGVNYLDVCKNAVNQPYGDEANAACTGILAVLTGEQETFNLEYPCHSPNQQRWFQMKVSPLHGSRRGAVVSHENITERKQAERVLVQLKAMIDICLDGFWIVDLKGNLLQVNEAYAKISGYSIDELMNMSISQLEAAEGSAQIQAHIATVVAQGYDLFETRHRHKDGHIIDIEISVAFLAEFQHFCVFCRDITQRKQIEAKLNAIFNASVEGIITIDLSDTIVSVNAAVETIFGYKPEELIGCSISKPMPSSSKQMNDSRLPRAVKCTGQIQEIEGIHKNGSLVPLDLSIAEYSIDNAHYFTYIVRDVSLRKHREQQGKEHLDQLAHVTRLGLMGEMASGIAHEVNQPLTAISSYTQVSLNLINTEHPDLVLLSGILDKTRQQALRAGRIIHRMREFVKSHSKHRSSADINTLIYDAANLCIAELKHNHIKLKFELKDHLPHVYVDHVQIEQVIINLVRNSIEALQNLPGNQEHQLTIYSQLTLDNVIEVRVTDNGPGIDEDQQQKILMPFYTTKTDGMGMGLSISRSIIEAHEGSLHFNSQPGKGTTFYFTLPIRRNYVEC